MGTDIGVGSWYSGSWTERFKDLPDPTSLRLRFLALIARRDP